MRASIAGRLLAWGLALCAAACDGDPAPVPWQTVHADLPGALLSVWGTSATDVWAVGADPGDGNGPTVLHFDGSAWRALDTGESGDLWWVFGFAGGPVYMGGSGGLLLRYQGGGFTRMTTPGGGSVFGIWGASPDDVWAVGGALGGAQGAFAWRLSGGGDTWTEAPGFPAELAQTDAIWKVFGRAADDVWLVGTGGKVLHWDGQALEQSSIGIAESLFTVHASGGRFAAVGGFGTALILENDGGGWVDVSPPAAPAMIGVCLTEDGGGWAVGQYGVVYRRGGGGAWVEEKTEILLEGQQSLHSVWVDPDGGVWAVGGEVSGFPLVNGVMLHRGPTVPGGVSP